MWLLLVNGLMLALSVGGDMLARRVSGTFADALDHLQGVAYVAFLITWPIALVKALAPSQGRPVTLSVICWLYLAGSGVLLVLFVIGLVRFLFP